MSPAQLDMILNGAFIYARPDGTRFASIDYKLADWGTPLVGRAGPMAEDDLAGGVDAYLARQNALLPQPLSQDTPENG